MSLREFAETRVKELLERFYKELGNVSKHHDPTAIHDLRVSIRRLAEALRALKELFPARVEVRVRGRLRRLMDLSANVRNYDIALELCTAAGISHETPQCRKMIRARKTAARQLASCATQLKKNEILSDWKKLLVVKASGKGSWRPDASVQENAARQLPEVVEEYAKAGRKVAHKKAKATKLHRFRLRTKHFRYLLDLFSPFYGDDVETMSKRLREIQSLLGEINDYATVREMMAKSSELMPLFDYLDKEQAKKVNSFLRYWKGKMDAEGQKKHWKKCLSNPVDGRGFPPKPSA
ncbi:MAG TPA: CHAD domain-containing protein [Bryobacteraceae bacterium]|nr:CHAD domain-containing protein [Bryobacteraceae bacterium]